LGLTRGRVYETLDDVESILAVRWPNGRTFTDELAGELAAGQAEDEVVALVDSARQTFFPARHEPEAPIPFVPGANHDVIAAGLSLSECSGCR
jgi:hypothetical protein